MACRLQNSRCGAEVIDGRALRPISADVEQGSFDLEYYFSV